MHLHGSIKIYTIRGFSVIYKHKHLIFSLILLFFTSKNISSLSLFQLELPTPSFRQVVIGSGIGSAAIALGIMHLRHLHSLDKEMRLMKVEQQAQGRLLALVKDASGRIEKKVDILEQTSGRMETQLNTLSAHATEQFVQLFEKHAQLQQTSDGLRVLLDDKFTKNDNQLSALNALIKTEFTKLHAKMDRGAFVVERTPAGLRIGDMLSPAKITAAAVAPGTPETPKHSPSPEPTES